MKTPYLFRTTDIAALPEQRSEHQFNANAVRLTKTLGSLAGLSRIGLHMVRLEPDRESTELHSHDNDEEFIYIVSGTGTATIGHETYEVSAGDLMAFPLQSPPHALHNTGAEDLIYLMGGERNSADVVHYPRQQRTMVKTAGQRYYTDWAHQIPLEPKP